MTDTCRVGKGAREHGTRLHTFERGRRAHASAAQRVERVTRGHAAQEGRHSASKTRVNALVAHPTDIRRGEL
jgi:hypothetical protein